MKVVTLNAIEQKRVMLLGEVEGRRLTLKQAAAVAGRSVRQVKRWLASFRARGAAGIAHGNRGCAPANQLPKEVRDKVKTLAAGPYAGLNICHLTDLLAEREGLVLSRSSVRRIITSAGLKGPRTRRAPKHRSRRERFPKEGMLLQLDASHHDWLEDRGPWLTLVGAVDDATGIVPYALFREAEDTVGYFHLLEGIVSRQGIPLAVYHDRCSVFVINPPHQSEETPGITTHWDDHGRLTQFGRMLKELAIESIVSHSPQGRGRIERLWGTFQGRLVGELRLAGACTLADANRVLGDFLVRYNERFGVAAADPVPAWRQVWAGFRYEDYFCLKERRVVGSDNVVQYEGRRLQVLSCHGRNSYARLEVEVHEDPGNGELQIYYQGKQLATRPAPLEASVQRKTMTHTAPHYLGRPVQAAASDHPWRRWVHQAPQNKTGVT